MLRLLEITYTNDKESAALYDGFADVTALTADFDTKMGAAIKADAYKAEYLLAFDDEGNIYSEGYDSKDSEVTLNPRLVFVTKTAEGATANQSKEVKKVAKGGSEVEEVEKRKCCRKRG